MIRSFLLCLALVCGAMAHAQAYNAAFDHNEDGCVGAGDLVELLEFYGGCYNWQCGDPVIHWDYAYETAQIDEECWFSENLRSSTYTNGDSIPTGLSDVEWGEALSGACAVYGDNESTCDNWYASETDPCESVQSLALFGRLYNWYAVDDARGLCPNGWHVATESEWLSLIADYGGIDEAGPDLKATEGWFNEGGGTNASGFGAFPGGRRTQYGNYSLAVHSGYWWSSTAEGSWAWYRAIKWEDDITRSTANPVSGYSVRCVED